MMTGQSHKFQIELLTCQSFLEIGVVPFYPDNFPSLFLSTYTSSSLYCGDAHSSSSIYLYACVCVVFRHLEFRHSPYLISFISLK